MALTREKAKEKLISLGIEEPTEEQITKFLNDVNSETQKEKEKAETLKAKADKAEELERQLNELKTQGLTEAEKLAQELEIANKNIAELERNNVLSEVKNVFNSAGLKEEDYNDYLKGFSNSDVETAKNMALAFVKTIENAKNETDKRVREELLDNTKGGGTGGRSDEKTEAEKIAENIGKSLAGASKESNDIISSYAN